MIQLLRCQTQKPRLFNAVCAFGLRLILPGPWQEPAERGRFGLAVIKRHIARENIKRDTQKYVH